MRDIKSKVLEHHIEIVSLVHEACYIFQFVASVVDKVWIINQRRGRTFRDRVRLHHTIIHTLDFCKNRRVVHIIIVIYDSLFIT